MAAPIPDKEGSLQPPEVDDKKVPIDGDLKYPEVKGGDVESSSGSAAAPAVETTARVLDHVAERKLCRRLDLRLLPVLAVMCEFDRRSM